MALIGLTKKQTYLLFQSNLKSTMAKKLTYAKAGVDIFKHKKAIGAIEEELKFSRRGIGKPLKIKHHFAGLIDFGKYALALCTDGVGTKILVAQALKKYDTLGIDCIAMNVNDCICVGAEPLAFVDYIALQKPNQKLVAELGKGLNKGAEIANISIIGGETAIVPELVRSFDLAGTCLGYVRKKDIISGESIKPGDIIIGLKSSGIHSNGLTLARKVLEKNRIKYTDKFPGSNKTWGEILLEPTEIYVQPIISLFKLKLPLHGLAHITGSGIRKISRLNRNVKFVLEDLFQPQKIFQMLQELGNIDIEEMHQTFNMGMGFSMIVDEKYEAEILQLLKSKSNKRIADAKVIGRVEAGKGIIIPKLGINYP